LYYIINNRHAYILNVQINISFKVLSFLNVRRPSTKWMLWFSLDTYKSTTSILCYEFVAEQGKVTIPISDDLDQSIFFTVLLIYIETLT